jgi:hypothetical protein
LSIAEILLHPGLPLFRLGLVESVLLVERSDLVFFGLTGGGSVLLEVCLLVFLTTGLAGSAGITGFPGRGAQLVVFAEGFCEAMFTAVIS